MIHIIIPVYKGLEETVRCIDSVLNSSNKQLHCITLINDSSPEPELSAYLRCLSGTGNLKVLHNEQNLGFVATVNLGMQLIPEADVVLLNSDTEVSGDWLDRLHRCAYSGPKIGTVTPFSNNATICSYPEFCADNELAQELSTEILDNFFREANPHQHIELPTAVGFCMYIKRKCLEDTGLFDEESFGKGYGEENDFSMRARKRGWKHVLCADVFVRHSGGISFETSQYSRKATAQGILRHKYPHYLPLVRWHILQDPARVCRYMVDFLRLSFGKRPVVLFVTHRRGGGTERHIRELTEFLDQDAEVLVLRPYLWQVVVLEWIRPGEKFRLFFRSNEDYGSLISILRKIGVSQIHYHHLFGHDQIIMNIHRDLAVPFYFTAHDYFSICPRISLTSINHTYCGEPDPEQCNICLKSKPLVGVHNIDEWRDLHHAFLRQAQTIFAPSNDVAKRFQHYFPLLNINVIPHQDIASHTQLPLPKIREIGADERLRIVVIGGLSAIKGADILEACAKHALERGLPLSFELIGHAYRDLDQLSNLTVSGPYNDSDLMHLIREADPHLIWFPALWPETYSYTLSAALLSGTPVVVTNLGALPERISFRPWSWVCDWKWTAEEWGSFFVQIRERHFVATGFKVGWPEQPMKSGTRTNDSYKHYVMKFRPSNGSSMDSNKAVRDLISLHSRPRFSKVEWIIFEARRVIFPLLRILRVLIPCSLLRKMMSPYNRARLKEWLSGSWPS